MVERRYILHVSMNIWCHALYSYVWQPRTTHYGEL